MIDYGILQEKSDLRAHVSVVGACVYVFRTHAAIQQIGKYLYPIGTAFTDGIATGKGRLVPPRDIEGLKTIDIPQSVLSSQKFDSRESTSRKGDKAVNVVRQLLLSGLFPIESASEIVENKDLQIDGYDITVKLQFHIQVKCDWKSGDRAGCTGNLFIQIAERNIYSQH